MQKLEIVYKNIDELLPYINNARTHDEMQINQIASSIKEFGFNSPIAIDNDNVILCGHGRLLGAKKLGLKEVPTVCLSHLTPQEKKAYILADNKIALNSGWDFDLLKLEFEDLKSVDFDLSLTGFSDNEINDLFKDIDQEVKDDDFDVDSQTSDVNIKSALGDIWVCGNHRVMCGDSTSFDDVEKLMGGHKADLLITDPPYNVDYQGCTKDSLKIMNDKMSDDSFRQFLRDAFSTADSVMREGAVFYIWYADVESYNFNGACIDVGWEVRQCLIWAKPSLILGRKDYQWKHEPCLYGWKEGAPHLWCSDRKQTTILEFDKPLRNGEHPTMKPVPLFDYQIKNSTNVNDKVLDLFGGSGTTMIACEQNNRKSYLMELDPKYVDVIVKRWQKLTGLEAYRLSDNVKFNDL